MIEINQWSLSFESADTRKRQRLGWFLAPSGCDSKGFRTLMRDGKDGLAALGFFQALCQSMATQNSVSRKAGIFQNSDGKLMDFDDIMELSRLNGMEPADHRQIVGRLVSIGWISLHKSLELEQSAGHLPPSCRSSPGFVKGEGEEQGQVEGQEKDSLSAKADEGDLKIIESIWKLFPTWSRSRSSKLQVQKEWAKIRPKPLEVDLIAQLEKWAKCHEWTKDSGQYAPGAHLWIRNRKWEDDPAPAPRPAQAGFTPRPLEVDTGNRKRPVYE